MKVIQSQSLHPLVMYEKDQGKIRYDLYTCKTERFCVVHFEYAAGYTSRSYLCVADVVVFFVCRRFTLSRNNNAHYENKRVAVAPSGTTIVNEEGEEMVLKDTSVGGVMSQGMFCDSKMLGWIGGAAGVAVQIPESIEIGSSPPSSKPRVNFQEDDKPPPEPQVVQGLYEKKLTKEEKKKLAEEKRKARKVAKEAKKAEAES